MSEPNPYHFLYLWFKSLFNSDDYQSLCENKTNLPELQRIYPNIHDNYKLWGDIFSNEDADVAFGLWVERNQLKINQQEFFNYRVVRAGESIKPEYGFVYYTVASDASPIQLASAYKEVFTDNLKHLQSKLSDATLSGTQVTTVNGVYFPFNRTGFNKKDKVESNAKRLSAYLSYKKLSISLSKPRVLDSLEALRLSFIVCEDGTWHEDIWQTEKARLTNKGLSLNDYQDDDVKSEIMSFKKLAKQGQNLIAHATNNSFPDYTTYKP